MSLKTNINVLQVLVPSNTGASGGGLSYDLSKNEKALRNNVEQLPAVWEEFLKTEPGSAEEKQFANDLSGIYLGATALQSLKSVKTGEDRENIAHWFTEQSIERYGSQEVIDTLETMQTDLRIAFEQHRTGRISDDTYEEFLANYKELGIEPDSVVDGISHESVDKENESTFRRAFIKNYGHL